MDSLPRVFLIRHGETEWSLSGKHTGRTDVPLTARGEERARDVGTRLAGITFARVLSSPRQRATRTCTLAGLSATMEIREALAEWDYGAFEGLVTAEIQARQPNWNVFRDGAPGGESPTEVAARADDVVRELKTMSGAIAVFSHGHFLRALAVRWIGEPIATAHCLLLDTAAVSVLTFEHRRLDEPAIQLWNSTSGNLGG